MNDFETISFNIQDAIATITLNRPDAGNPFDEAFNSELLTAAIECDEREDVRCVVIDSNGPYFSVGADLNVLRSDRQELPKFIKRATATLHMAISRLARMNAPLVSSIRGLAVGGSVALVAASDFAIAGESAQFYSGYTGIGLVPDGSPTYFLPRRVGSRRAVEFLMLNETWDATRAADVGLISYVVKDQTLDSETFELSNKLATGPTYAYGEIKNLLLSTWEQPLEAQIEAEARAMARAARTDDAWNAMGSVLAKDSPEFKGY